MFQNLPWYWIPATRPTLATISNKGCFRETCN